MAFASHPVPAPLAPLVDAIWSLDRTGPVHVLPDGCIDLIASERGLHVAGPMTVARTPAVSGLAVGVRFRPGVAPALLGAPADALRDLDVPLDELLPGLRVDGQDRAALAASLAALVQRLAARAAPDGLVAAAVARLATAPEQPVRALADDLGVLPRTLLRRFDGAVGYGPKRLGRVLRLRRALRLAAAPGASWARVAFDAGYADQAHLVRDCRALAGAPPTVVLEAVTEEAAVRGRSRVKQS